MLALNRGYINIIEDQGLIMFIRKHMSDFTCIGEACPDHCCAGWSVPISQADEDRLRPLLPPGEWEELTEPFNKKRRFVQSKGKCKAQCSQGLCQLQQSHGHESLPAVCASYPRLYVVRSGRHEIGGMLSCPEIARISLSEHDSMEWREEETPPRAVLDLEIGAGRAYEERSAEVQEHVDSLMLSSAPFAQRIHAVAAFAEGSPAFFNRSSGSEQLGRLYDRSREALQQQPTVSREDRLTLWTALLGHADSLARGPSPYRIPQERLQKAMQKWDGDHSTAAERFVDDEALFWSQNREEIEMVWTRYLRHDWGVRSYVHSPDLAMHWGQAFLKWGMIRLMLPFSEEWKEDLPLVVSSAERIIEHSRRKFDNTFSLERLGFPIRRLLTAYLPEQN
jgi:hypothetical protein